MAQEFVKDHKENQTYEDIAVLEKVMNKVFPYITQEKKAYSAKEQYEALKNF